jgi:hypothetical protein
MQEWDGVHPANLSGHGQPQSLRPHDHGAVQLRRAITRVRVGVAATGLFAALSFAACSSSSSAPLAENDSGSSDDASSDASGTGAKDAGQANPRDAASQTCGTRVNSGVAFTDAGGIYCAADMPCDLTSSTCCVNGLGIGTCKSGHNGCGGGTGLAAEAAFECVQDTDCPANQVCCGFADSSSMTAGSKCEALGSSTKCSPAPTTTQGSVQFCQKTCECKDGSECLPQSCDLGVAGVPPANLTMCGKQDQAPFNCTPR